MYREYHKWFSPRLGRDMELLVFGTRGRPILFFPTRMARFYDYENWRVIDAIRNRIDSGEFQIYCVDSVDAESFYNHWVHPDVRIRRHLQYEDYILHEVLPLVYQKNNANYLEVAGCSMGAYHAINLALKYPHLFKKAVGMSGRYDLTYPLPNFRGLFDDYQNQDIYFNMPLQYISNLHDPHLLYTIRQMEIILAIGENDAFLSNNRQLSELLWNKGIPNQLYIWGEEAHRPRYWRQMVQLYL